MANELLILLGIALARLIASIILSLGALYTGIKVLDRLTAGIDEWKEIKKGNVAVGIFYATVVLSLILLMEPRIAEFANWIQATLPWQTTLYMLALSLINYLLDLALSVLIIYLSINLIDKLTVDLNEMEALKKGNIAVALILSVMVLGVALVARYPLDWTFLVMKALEGFIPVGFTVV